MTYDSQIQMGQTDPESIILGTHINKDVKPVKLLDANILYLTKNKHHFSQSQYPIKCLQNHKSYYTNNAVVAFSRHPSIIYTANS